MDSFLCRLNPMGLIGCFFVLLDLWRYFCYALHDDGSTYFQLLNSWFDIFPYFFLLSIFPKKISSAMAKRDRNLFTENSESIISNIHFLSISRCICGKNHFAKRKFQCKHDFSVNCFDSLPNFTNTKEDHWTSLCLNIYLHFKLRLVNRIDINQSSARHAVCCFLQFAMCNANVKCV